MYKKILTFSFVGFFLFFLLVILVTPDKVFSENENDYLQTLPKFSWEGLFSGQFMTDFEEYIKDQFPFRDEFIAGKAKIELLIGKHSNNGVFLTEDHYMFTDLDTLKEDQMEKNISAVQNFADKQEIPVNTVVVPTQSLLLQNKLPSYVYFRNGLDVYENLKATLPGFIDLLPVMQEAVKDNQDIFFHTDHHWNSFGAYLGYKTILESLNIEGLDQSDYDKIALKEPFYGTMTSKSGFYFEPGDIMEIWDSGMTKELTIENGGETEVYDSVFLMENEAVKDKYTIFLGGNKPIHHIVNETAPIKEKVLLIKDSYAHILAPFLSDTFEEIVLVDLRYVKKSMSNYIEEEGFDRVIVLYSLSEFVSSTDLGLLR